MNLEWSSVDLAHISKPAWDQHIQSCNTSLINSSKMMRVLIKSDNKPLARQYERSIDHYVYNVKLLSFVAPAYIQSFVETIRERIDFAYSKLDKLLVVLDTVKNDSLNEQFLDELARYNAASDIYNQLSGIEFAGIVRYEELEQKEQALADYLDDAFGEADPPPADVVVPAAETEGVPGNESQYVVAHEECRPAKANKSQLSLF